MQMHACYNLDVQSRRASCNITEAQEANHMAVLLASAKPHGGRGHDWLTTWLCYRRLPNHTAAGAMTG